MHGWKPDPLKCCNRNQQELEKIATKYYKNSYIGWHIIFYNILHICNQLRSNNPTLTNQLQLHPTNLHFKHKNYARSGCET